LSNMFELPKYGGSLLKMKLRVTLNSSCPNVPGVIVQNMTEPLLIYHFMRLKMRTRIIVVPCERRRMGGS